MAVMPSARRLAPLLSAAVAATTLAGAGSAAAGTIFFTCGAGNVSNICRAKDDGSGRRQLTRDGKSFAPSASRDGKRLVYQRNGKAVIADGNAKTLKVVGAQASVSVSLPKINARGTKIVWTEIAYVYFPYTSQIPYICTVAVAGADKPKCEGSAASHVGWGPGDRVMGTDRNTDKICLLDNEYDDCTRDLAVRRHPEYIGFRPELSPNGKMLATTVAPEIASKTWSIALFNTANGATTRMLPAGTDDDPVFSPDGKRIAFTRKGAIWAVGVGGGRATRLIAKGSYPSWSR
jgi:hypothetical protein